MAPYGVGGGSYGETGDGLSPTLSRWFPRQVGTAVWAYVVAGNNVSFGIKPNGTLWAWGKNHIGQLGDGTTTNQPLPVQIGTATNWARVVTGSHATVVATKTDGTVWAWGRNNEGQYGNGIIGNNQQVPTQITTICSLAATNFQTQQQPTLYPNPARDYITLSYQVTTNNAIVTIYDLSGRIVQILPLHKGKAQQQVPVGNYSKGVYILTLEENNQLLLQQKLVIE